MEITRRYVDPDALAEALKAKPELIREFEESYRRAAINWKKDEDNLFEHNSREASANAREGDPGIAPNELLEDIKARIVKALIRDTVYRFDSTAAGTRKRLTEGENALPVPIDEIMSLPAGIRPQTNGDAAPRDVAGCAGLDLLGMWVDYLNEKEPSKRERQYKMFRQGLDILDLDPIVYEMLGQNPNAMGNWLPQVAEANAKRGFFRIPETVVVKVPLPILQLTRIGYEQVNRTTRGIVNEWAREVFHLAPTGKYFIKTGTFSSKFDFRNAKVAEEKEVGELGEYLLYLQFQAQQMASPLAHPVIYGASTTNEWVVREYVEDVENNPTIYKGLPLHTEYRVFADMDANEVMGVVPYWEPNIMKTRFIGGAKASPHDYHDYVVYKAHEGVLMDRFRENADTVREKIRELLPDIALFGQWSMDIMQNGEDFWIIDMATADTSALKELLTCEVKERKIDWIKGAKRLLAGYPEEEV